MNIEYQLQGAVKMMNFIKIATVFGLFAWTLAGSLTAEEELCKPKKRIKLVILDNSGTTNDCGVYAPAVVFIQVFEKHNVAITMEEARKPMGLFKKDHIRAILQIPRVADAFVAQYGRPSTESDVENMFADFVPMQMACLEEYSDLIPGCAETVKKIREEYGVVIGSTTGFSKEMNDVLLSKANEQGYYPDVHSSATVVPRARPYWYMVLDNMEQAEVLDPEEVLKVGDTRGDMQEGKAIGAVRERSTWTLGLAATGNYVGKTWKELIDTDGDALQREIQVAERILYDAGADYVAPNINSLPVIIERINARLANDEHPREIAHDYLD